MKKRYLSKIVSKKRKRTDNDSSSSSSVFSKISPVSTVNFSNYNKGNNKKITAKEAEPVSLFIDTIERIQETVNGNSKNSKKAEA